MIFEPAACNLEDFLENPEGKFNDLRTRLSIKKVLNDTNEGLNHLHQKKIIHFDLKPVNILIIDEKGSNLKALIADFDISKSISNLTQFLSVINTQRGTEVS